MKMYETVKMKTFRQCFNVTISQEAMLPLSRLALSNSCPILVSWTFVERTEWMRRVKKYSFVGNGITIEKTR